MSLITINGTATNVTATGEDVVTVVQEATTLDSLSDVETNTLATGDLLVYDTSSSTWLTQQTLTGTYTFDNALTLSDTLEVESNITQNTGRLYLNGQGLDRNTGEINVYCDLNLQDNALSNVNNINVTTAKIKKISPEQFENAFTPRTRFYSDWSHPNHQAAVLPGDNNDVDISGEFLLGAGDLSAISQGLPFSAMDMTTPNGHSVFFLGAAGGDFTDGQSDDNATHNCKMYLRGEENVISSVSEASLGTYKKLTIDSGDFSVNSTGQVTLNGEFINVADNKASFVVRPSYSTQSGDIVDFTRRNAEDGTNDSDIADGSEVKFNFYIESADETSQQLIGGFTASTHATNGNQFLITMDDQAQTGSVNNLTLKETVTQIDKPLQFPSFSTTDRDAMSPNNGWVLYNSTTNKLQVYANGSWVDLH